MKIPALIRSLVIIGFFCVFAPSIQAGTTFVANLDGLQATPMNASIAAGIGSVILNGAETEVTATLYFTGLSAPQTAAHIHSPAPRGAVAGIIQTLPNGNFSQTYPVSAAEVANLKAGLWYFNIHNQNFPGGEIRGQIELPVAPNLVPFPFSNGSLDKTFSSNGMIIQEVGDNSAARSVAIQTDGKIVIAGFNTNGSISSDFTLVRYNPDGTLDNSFGDDGIVTTALNDNFDIAFAVTIQTNGKIIAAGQTTIGANTRFAIVRYNSDGTLDETFDGDSGIGNGIVVTVVGIGNQTFRSIVVQPDGKIIGVGDSVSDGNASITVIRYNSDGTLDTSFDGNSGMSNGVVITRIGAGAEHAYGVKLQQDGKLVVAGYYSNGLNNDVALLRYNTDGTLDTSFDNDGIAVTAIGTRTDEAFDLALQDDGKIVIAGCINSGSGNDFLNIRYNIDGTLDKSFGNGGATITPIGSGSEIAFKTAIQSDGKILSVGFSSTATNRVFAIIRQNSDGSLDTSFDGDGIATTQIGDSVAFDYGLAIQADGKIVAVGRAVIGSRGLIALLRYGYGTNDTTDDGFFALNQATDIRFDNAFKTGTTSVNSFSAIGLPPLPKGLNLLTSPQIITTSAEFSGGITVKIKLPSNIDEPNFNAAQIRQFENGLWVDKTTAAPSRDFATRTIYARVSILAPLAVLTSLTPPNTSTSITGRALSPQSKYASGAIVSFMDEQGRIRYAIANAFGFFRFQNVTVGEPFIFRVNSKRFIFAPRILSFQEGFVELNLSADARTK